MWGDRIHGGSSGVLVGVRTLRWSFPVPDSFVESGETSRLLSPSSAQSLHSGYEKMSPKRSPSKLLLVRVGGAWQRAQEEAGPELAAQGQQVGAESTGQIAQQEACPGVLRHTVGEWGSKVHGGTHVGELGLGGKRGGQEAG